MIPVQYRHLPPLVSIPVACDALGVSRRTIYNWMAAGKIEWVLTPSGLRQIVTESLWRGSNGER